MASGKAYAVVLGVALAASATSLANGFVFDDVRVVQQDERVHSLHHLAALLTGPYWSRDYANSNYRPATTVSFALDWAIGVGRPLAFHATNVLLHLVVVALVLALASLVLSAPGAVASARFDRNYYAPELTLLLSLARATPWPAEKWREAVTRAGYRLMEEVALQLRRQPQSDFPARPFPLPHRHLVPLKIHVLDPQPHAFHQPQPGAIQQFGVELESPPHARQ